VIFDGATDKKEDFDMGWKTLKEHFDIEHFVQVTKKGICIGSGFVHDLVTIDPKTGALQENQTFHGLIREKYPALLKAPPPRNCSAYCCPRYVCCFYPCLYLRWNQNY
jgi:hypothetical protein